MGKRENNKKKKSSNKKRNKGPKNEEERFFDQVDTIAKVITGLTIVAINIFQTIYNDDNGKDGESKSSNEQEVVSPLVVSTSSSSRESLSPSSSVVNNNYMFVNATGISFKYLRSLFPKDDLLVFIHGGMTLSSSDAVKIVNNYHNDPNSRMIQYIEGHPGGFQSSRLAIENGTESTGSESPARRNTRISSLEEIRHGVLTTLKKQDDMMALITAIDFNTVCVSTVLNCLASIPIFISSMHEKKYRNWLIAAAVTILATSLLLFCKALYSRWKGTFIAAYSRCVRRTSDEESDNDVSDV